MSNLRAEVRGILRRVSDFPERYHMLVLDRMTEADHTTYKICHVEMDPETEQEYTDGWPKPVVAYVKAQKAYLGWRIYDNTPTWYTERRVDCAVSRKRAEGKAIRRAEKIAQIISRRTKLQLTNKTLLEAAA